jgi:hypothetical protein
MKISTILDYIDSGHIALPEFQRGYLCPTPENVKSAWDTLVGSVRVKYTSPLRQVQSQKPVKIGLV